jgi:colicin import membrane protein
MRKLLKWLLTMCVILTLVGIAATGCASTEETAIGDTRTEKNAAVESEPAAPIDTVEAVETLEEETPRETAGQENARRSAQSYLETAAFSRKGLIGQLKYEGYSTADATYAVDAVRPDWNEQAARAAAAYLETSAFSRKGLIGQLRYEGYTEAQAVYGVNQTGLSDGGTQEAVGGGGTPGNASRETPAQANARRSAESYLETASFSRKGLIGQLEYEGFSNADATYAVDAIKPDWNEQAAKSAKSYLETSGFSRSGLIDQLMYEGFTEQQAVYGVNKAGL